MAEAGGHWEDTAGQTVAVTAGFTWPRHSRSLLLEMLDTHSPGTNTEPVTLPPGLLSGTTKRLLEYMLKTGICCHWDLAGSLNPKVHASLRTLLVPHKYLGILHERWEQELH